MGRGVAWRRGFPGYSGPGVDQAHDMNAISHLSTPDIAFATIIALAMYLRLILNKKETD